MTKKQVCPPEKAKVHDFEEHEGYLIIRSRLDNTEVAVWSDGKYAYVTALLPEYIADNYEALDLFETYRDHNPNFLYWEGTNSLRERATGRITFFDYPMLTHWPKGLDLNRIETSHNVPQRYCPMICFQTLISNVAALFQSSYRIGEDLRTAKDGHQYAAGFDLAGWKESQTKRVLGKRLYAWWQKQTARMNPDVLKLQKRAFALYGGKGNMHILMNAEFLKRKRLVADCINYRAALAAVMFFDMMPVAANDVDVRYHWNQIFMNHPWFQENFAYRVNDSEEEFTLNDLLDGLENWQYLYTEYGTRPSHTLSKMLMNMPGGVEINYLTWVTRLEPPFAITDRYRWIALQAYSMKFFRMRYEQNGFGRRYRQLMAFYKILERTSPEQAKEAARRMGRFTHAKNLISPKAVRSIFYSMLDVITEDNGVNIYSYKGTLVGLADESIRWHKWQEEEAVRLEAQRAARLTKLPPVPLPEADGVQFLATVGDVIKEGAHMHHCIASYAGKAESGYCYLFHVDHQGEQASVEVSPTGDVLQSYGPHDTRNKATEYGQRVLRRWGKKLKGYSVSPAEDELSFYLGLPEGANAEIPF